jgi:hypothetical protein
MTVGTLSPDEKNLYNIVFAIRQLQEGRSNATTREVLSANRTYYVRADGSDANDGQGDSASRAFLTLQKAIDTILKLDLAGFAVTIQLRTGTFAGFTLSFPFIGGSVTIVGDPATPANVIINSGIIVQNGATLTIGGVEFRANGHSIDVLTAGTVIINRKVNFGACGGFHMLAESAGGNIVVTIPAADGGYVINGSAGFGHFGASTGGVVTCVGQLATLTGTPSFGVAAAGLAFAYAVMGQIRAQGSVFSGAATGRRFQVESNGTIFTQGGGPNFFPGSTAGVIDGHGGEYV